MNSNKNKIIFSLSTLLLIIMVSFLVYQKEHKNLAAPTQTITKKNSIKATPLKYTGYTLLNKFNKATIENYPTAAGTYDLATMASNITSQMLQAFSTTKTKTLPLVANWNVGIPEYSDGLDPLYMINRLTNGESLIPTWKLDPYYNDSIGLSYYETSIKKAAELGLPLVFTLPSPESALTKDDVYFTMDKTNNPNVITPKGIVLPKLSPFGPDSLWNEVGGQWSTTSLMAQLQEWYPNPPLVIFIDEDSAAKLSWSELSSSSRYQTQYPSDGSDEFKRTLINAQWVEKYRQLHQGFVQGFTNDAWKKNAKFITRNQLAINMGTSSDWKQDATTTNLQANVWPLTANGLTINFDIGADKELLNNLPFMLDEAKNINPNFVSQLSIDAHQKITNPNTYRGYTQLALWLLRPNIVRQTSNGTTKTDINPLFQQVVDSVELINNNDILADFWKNGKLVTAGDSNFNLNIPTKFQTAPREFFLKTDATVPVYAFALKKGIAPNREWLIYTQSPDENLSNITITIPTFKDVTVNSTGMGSFNIIAENNTVKSLNNNTDETSAVKELVDNLLISTKQSLDNFKYDLETFSLNKTFEKEFFVSTTGNDNNPGTIDKPFKTITKARDSVRAYKNNNGIPNGGIVVWIRGGSYYLTNILRFTADDSGSKDSPIVYSAYKNEKVYLIGGKKLDNSWFQSVTSADPLWNRLNISARDHLKSINLAKHGITDLGTLEEDKDNSIVPPELFDNNQALDLARWPDRNITTRLQTINDNIIILFGDITPDVTGRYIKESSNPPIFKHDGLINGVQYYIKRIESTKISDRRSWVITDENNKKLWSYTQVGFNLPKEFINAYAGSKGIPSLLNKNDKQFGFAFISNGIDDKTFQYTENNPKNWMNTGDIWINGMLQYAWSNRHAKIKNIDKLNNQITFQNTPTYGIHKGKSKRAYYSYNILEELSTEGEYYIDRDTAIAYVWPLENIDKSNFIISTNTQTLIYLDNASSIQFYGLTIEDGRNSLVEIKNGHNNLIDHCILKNSGKWLIKISGRTNGIQYSELSEAGEAAIILSGGTRSTLISGNNFVKNNNIHDLGRWQWTSKGAVKLSGVGNIIEHNNIFNIKHQAINYTGNNHSIQYNNMYNIETYSEDSGAIYAGRNWGYRGNKINNNFIHNLINNYGAAYINGIYFDDSLSGNEAIGNIFYNIDGHAIYINGGRNNIVENNIFYKVATAFLSTNSGYKSVNNIPGSSFNLLEKLHANNISYNSGIWAQNYPRLAKMPDDWEQIKNSKWLLPIGNVFKDNIFKNVLKTAEGVMENNFNLYNEFNNTSVTSTDNLLLSNYNIGIVTVP